MRPSAIKRVGVDALLRRDVAVPVDEVVVGDRLLEQEVQEEVREDGALGRASECRGSRSARLRSCRATRRRGRPDGTPRRHVVKRAGEQVARPRVVQVHRPFGEGLVVGDRDLDVADVGQLLEVVPGLGDDLGVIRVEVRDRAVGHCVALHRHREAVALVVEEADLAPPLLRLPEDVPRDVELGDVHRDLVVAPADAVRPDDVGHRVVRAEVVERVGQRPARCSRPGSAGRCG